jgi:gamma-glutamyltranspeptidase
MLRSAGIGGDAFGLFYSAATREVTALLGNGRSPAGLTMDVSTKLLISLNLGIAVAMRLHIKS